LAELISSNVVPDPYKCSSRKRKCNLFSIIGSFVPSAKNVGFW